ncbi:MAG: HNH endonuclease [Selenomonadaceae bacterium]|nr:HNH endonuclease [Selenomonadaceae bacterium]
MTVDRRKEKLKKMKKKMRERLKKDEGTILPQQINEKGNPTVTLEKDGESKVFEVKYLIAETFVPNPDNKPFVIHKNGNKQDNRADNLEWSDVDED